MIRRMPTHCYDETCPSCVVAGDFIYLAHHAGKFDRQEITYQMRTAFDKMQKTLQSAGASLNDMVQINLYLRNLSDFDAAIDVFREYFDAGCFPARMTQTTDFLDAECLCMIDGVAYKPGCAEGK